MEENKTPEIPEMPAVPEIKSDEEKIKELEMAITNLQFFTDTVRFNQIIYQGISLILEKLTKIEERIGTK